ncbi:MAG TPA: hypothetical protein VIA18_28690 [Polyangia bacterium]|jgi:hypothetical protein|nr:hypothetical protein [Polyangia bacterium]
MAASPAQKFPPPPSSSPANDPLHSLLPGEAARIVSRRGRLRALIVLGVAAAMIGLEWYTITHENKFSPKAVILAVCCVALGIPGLIEPRIILAMGRAKDRALVKEPRYRIIGLAILVPAAIGAMVLCEWLQR